eukprot:ctg_1363.g613
MARSRSGGLLKRPRTGTVWSLRVEEPETERLLPSRSDLRADERGGPRLSAAPPLPTALVPPELPAQMPLAVAYTIERHERRILGTTQSVGEEIAELEQVLQLVRRGAFRLSSSKQPAPQPSTSSLRDLLRAPMAYLSARWAGNHSTVETSIEPALAPTVERALHRRYAPVHNALQTLQAQLRHAQRRMLLACSRLQHAIGGSPSLIGGVSAEPQPVQWPGGGHRPSDTLPVCGHRPRPAPDAHADAHRQHRRASAVHGAPVSSGARRPVRGAGARRMESAGCRLHSPA